MEALSFLVAVEIAILGNPLRGYLDSEETLSVQFGLAQGEEMTEADPKRGCGSRHWRAGGIVKILALEPEREGAMESQVLALLEHEALQVWSLSQEDFIRDIRFRADAPTEVLTLECESVEEAKRRLSSLPLVEAQLVDFKLIPLAPYPGLARLCLKQTLVLLENNKAPSTQRA